jgi:hypothetical protein
MVQNGMSATIIHGSEWDVSYDCLLFSMSCHPRLFMVLNRMSVMIAHGAALVFIQSSDSPLV